MVPKTATPRIVVLKGAMLYGDILCRQSKEYWSGAQVQVFQKGFDALEAIQASTPDMFITGVKIEDMDGLEHLEPFIERDLPILIVTTRKDARTLSLLREIRYNGLFDVRAETYANFHTAMQRVLQREIYVSPTFAPHVKRPKNITLDALTEKEEMVLSVIVPVRNAQAVLCRLDLPFHGADDASLVAVEESNLPCFAARRLLQEELDGVLDLFGRSGGDENAGRKLDQDLKAAGTSSAAREDRVGFKR